MTFAHTKVEDLMQHQIIEAFRPTDNTDFTRVWTIDDCIDGLNNFVVDVLSEYIDPAFLLNFVWSTIGCSCCRCFNQRLGTTPDQLVQYLVLVNRPATDVSHEGRHVVVKEIDPAPDPTTVVLAWPRDRTPSPRLQAFVDWAPDYVCGWRTNPADDLDW